MASETPHYTLSQDYERMLVLLETGPLLGFVNYDPGDNLRDPVQIKRAPYPSGHEYRVGVRGLGYLGAWGKDPEGQFVAQCRKHNLSYIVPNVEGTNA